MNYYYQLKITLVEWNKFGPIYKNIFKLMQVGTIICILSFTLFLWKRESRVAKLRLVKFRLD